METELREVGNIYPEPHKKLGESRHERNKTEIQQWNTRRWRNLSQLILRKKAGDIPSKQTAKGTKAIWAGEKRLRTRTIHS